MKTNIKLRRDTTQRAQPRTVTDAISIVCTKHFIGDPKTGAQVIVRKQQCLEFLPGNV